jgi:hypothetical protein
MRLSLVRIPSQRTLPSLKLWTALALEDIRHGSLVRDISFFRENITFLVTLELDSGQFASESWSSTPYNREYGNLLLFSLEYGVLNLTAIMYSLFICITQLILN